MVIGGPASANGVTWWQVAFNDDLTGWVIRGTSRSYLQRRRHSRSAPVLAASPPAPRRRCHGRRPTRLPAAELGFSPSGASGSLSVSPTVSTTYSITCAGSGGSTTRTTPLIVNPAPSFTWYQSLPVTFNNPAIVPFGGTETRALIFMDGSLYAGIGDWEDPRFEKAQTPGAQVLRLNSPTSSWVEDQDFNQPMTWQAHRQELSGGLRSRDGAFRSRLRQQSDYASRRPHGRFLEPLVTEWP